MSKYFMDCEFLEGTQTKKFLGIPIGQGWKILGEPYIQTKPTIDLISIGIVSDDNREYYAISKDFNLKEAWNRYDVDKKIYWIRENVLKPIFNEWKNETNSKIVRLQLPISLNKMEFNFKNFKNCIKYTGKSNEEISKDIKRFIGTKETIGNWDKIKDKMNTQFYGYYSDYDWVVFCWLFGKMIDLPSGFPKYCVDLQQMLEDKATTERDKTIKDTPHIRVSSLKDYLKFIKRDPKYPQQTNEHNALEDARWNKQLYEFLIKTIE